MTSASNPSNGVPSSIDCVTAVRRLWDYLDGRLTAVAHDEVEAHLATCALCPPHFAFAERIKRSLAGRSMPAISDDDEARLRERVRLALAHVASESKDSRNSS